jgi:flagellar M-ring protein FliF
MLARSLGPNRTRAEATITYDYEQLHETQERFDPEGQVVRSTQTVSSSSKSTEASGAVTVQNNLPNADSGTSPTGSQEQRQEETTNYEVTKTVRTIIRDQPQIARLSMAVMVDGSMQKMPDGTMAWQERKPEELAQISRLVRSAVGYNEKRGDVVDVVSLRFAAASDQMDDAAPERWPFGLEKSDVMRVANTLLVGILVLIAALLVFRPMVAKLTLGVTAADAVLGRQAVPLLAGDAGTGGLNAASPNGNLGSNAVIAGLLPAPANGSRSMAAGSNAEADEQMMNIANIQGQIQASSIRKISDLVDRHPDESLSIIRAWMHQEPA